MQPKAKAMSMVRSLVTRTGNKIPQISLGTYQITGNQCLKNIRAALDAGYTHIDTAQFYDNQEELGRAIKASGVSRDKLFISSKLSFVELGERAASKGCDQMLEHLGVGYLDLMMIHWPGLVGLSPNSPQNTKLRLTTWKGMIELKKQGKVKDIGVANFLPRHLQTLRQSSQMPVVNQIQLNPANFDQETIGYCRKNEILISATSPLSRRPSVLMENSFVKELAAKYNKTSAQILLNWSIVQGFIVCAKSSRIEYIPQNLDIFDFEISPTETDKLSNLGIKISKVLSPQSVKY